MGDKRIVPIVMPKWGLSMREGKVVGWLAEEGSNLGAGEAIVEIETDKIAGTVEAIEPGKLRRRIGAPDTVYPVKALLGVMADDQVSDADIDAYVASYVTPAAEEGEAAEGARYEFVEVAAGRLRYARRGSAADTVLLIHGFGGDLDNWLFNIDALAEHATVLALDLPGHGQSTKTIADPTLGGLAATVLSFLDALKVGKAHLVGHSLGGAIAMTAAEMAPQRVRSLTLVGSAGLGQEINAAYLTGFINASSRREMKPVLELLFADPAQVGRQLVEDILKYKRLDGVAAALRALADGVFAGGRQQAVPGGNATIPTLAIAGKDDRIIPAAHTANARAVRIEIVEGAGHMVQMEEANRFNRAVIAHISGRG
jgi:pyruvate dehydrogenase E2 component (dihydrolipoamide acetyltransferase)